MIRKDTWTQNEIEYLIAHYGSGSFSERKKIAMHLNRTTDAIKDRKAILKRAGVDFGRHWHQVPQCPVRDALTPEQVPVMMEFLGSLFNFATVARQRGVAPDVMEFAKQWREVGM